MNNITMLLISIAANLFGGILKKDINRKYSNDLFSYQLYNAVVSLFSAVFLILMSESIKFSFFTLIMGILFGMITLAQQIFNLYALEYGPFSYTSVIISLSTLIPTLSGALFWNENISFTQYVAIVLLAICIIFSVNKTGDKRVNVKWLLYSFTAFICTGLIGVMQKIHQTSEFKGEIDAFLIIAFGMSFISSFIFCIFTYKKHKACCKQDKNIRSVLNVLPVVIMIISGIFVAINNKFNLYLSGVLDSAFFFPVVNGGGLVLTSFAALIVFKEKLSLKQIVGIIIGIVSVILLCLN